MRKIVVLFALLGSFCKVYAQQADNEDGTYTNPIIWADFPDNDVIRVADTYYMVTTSMYVFPGVPILCSKDLVNWQYCAEVLPRFNQGPAYNLDGGNRYGRGQWASSIRYHNGKFYILFLTLDEGGFLCTASRAEGPWKLQKLPRPYYDAGLFFDDNGRNYVVSGNSKLMITEVNDSLAPLSKDSIVISKTQRHGLEGSHMYKINGYYYIYATYGGGDGYQACFRSKNVYGPYEEKVVLKDDMNVAGKGVHQGALIETQTKEWWSIIFQDRNGIGRVPTLQPVHWIDGWPILGVDGRAVVTYKKPNVGRNWPITQLYTSDTFDKSQLGLQWSWNHNPDEHYWSLRERPGYLRLKTAKVVDNLLEARNTLTQRTFGPYSTGSISMDIAHMKAGDLAGLALLQLPYAFVGVRATDRGRAIVMEDNGKTRDSLWIGHLSRVYLRAAVVATQDWASFSYSLDGKTFHACGDTLYMGYSLKMFTGNKFALFNYATKSLGGYIDCDWFHMDLKTGPANLYPADSVIEAEMYDEIENAHVAVCLDDQKMKGFKEQDVTNTINGSLIKFNHIRFKKGLSKLVLRIKPSDTGGAINLFVDDRLHAPYAHIVVPVSKNTKSYQTMVILVKPLDGLHSLTLKFMAKDNATVGDLNWIRFYKD